LGVLAFLAVGFGLASHAVLAKDTTRWVGPIAAAGFFAAGLLVSEAFFGWATEEELQPNIDGLSFDEVLLVWLPGLIVLFVVRHWVHERHLRERQASRGDRNVHA
jgi:hypothetical protein